MGTHKTQLKIAYDKEFMRRVTIKLNTKSDMDIIEFIEKQPSMQGYLKQLIREDMARKQNAAK